MVDLHRWLRRGRGVAGSGVGRARRATDVDRGGRPACSGPRPRGPGDAPGPARRPARPCAPAAARRARARARALAGRRVGLRGGARRGDRRDPGVRGRPAPAAAGRRRGRAPRVAVDGRAGLEDPAQGDAATRNVPPAGARGGRRLAAIGCGSCAARCCRTESGSCTSIHGPGRAGCGSSPPTGSISRGRPSGPPARGVSVAGPGAPAGAR